MSKKYYLMSITIMIMVGVTACNFPFSTQNQGGNTVLTAAAKTVEANLTQSAQQPTSTVPALPTNTPNGSAGSPATATTLPSAATATEECDKAQFVTDVTIPDGTTLSPDESFTKTWRLKNVGTCSWTPSYAVVFSSGDSMNGPATQALTGNVNPGQTLDLSVNLKAPSSNGTYKGYWKLKNASGVLFAQFYVDIKVSGGGGGSVEFAVTNVTYNVTTFDENIYDDCPKVTANITANGAGTVTYKWTRSDGASAPTKSLDFASAGTKSVETKWYLGSGASGSNYWLGIYIDEPNHQDFGHADVFKCNAP